jgi:hypothetical protein
MATNTYDALRTQTLTAATNSITFDLTGITGYTDLVLVMNALQTSPSVNQTRIRVGNSSIDTGSNYSQTILYGNGTSALSVRASNQSYIDFDYMGAPGISGNPNIIVANFMNYSNTTTNKTILHRSGQATTGTDAIVSMWRSTTAINLINIFTSSGNNWLVGSTFSLYGIRAEGVSPAPKATGGAIYSDTLYYYHVFASTGVFTPSQTISGQYLVVAGGGGGGGNNTACGGGGGGGYRSAMTGQLSGANSSPETAVSLVSGTNYTVTIGGGGTAGVAISAGGNGTASSIIGGAVSISSTGGGGGGAGNGVSGGSGGGGSGQTSNGTTGAAGTSLQGFAGGNGLQTGVNYSSAGGGGAGAVGSNGINQIGGNGGAGITSNLYGVVTFAGGGGGGNSNDAAGPQSIAGGLGGIGGGGAGGRGSNTTGQAGFSGMANTGGGGGGGASHTGTQVYNGGAGGSGIVMIRYLKA